MPKRQRTVQGSALDMLLLLLQPGLSVKRWIGLAVLGVAAGALGLAFVQQYPIGQSFFNLVGIASLRNADPVLRGAVFVGIGVLALGIAATGLFISIYRVRRRRRFLSIIDSIYVDRVLGVGPRIVAIGGGTGLASLLRGLKHYTNNITAIVTVADDGGSSGRLRTEMGILPPGDIRNCLVALADAEDVMQQLMDYRFATNGDLNGHSFGNMLIAALANIGGGFDRAIEMAGDLLAIRGKVTPSTSENVVLVGSTVTGAELIGESRIGTATERLRAVALIPENPRAHPDAIDAIEKADLIVLGPGSLFTSIAPNLLVPEIREAVNTSRALKMYIANVAEQPGETDGLTVKDHLEVILHYGGPRSVDIVLVNNERPLFADNAPAMLQLEKPPTDWPEHVAYASVSVLDQARPTRHDPLKLAGNIAATYRKYRGVRRRLRRLWR